MSSSKNRLPLVAAAAAVVVGVGAYLFYRHRNKSDDSKKTQAASTVAVAAPAAPAVIPAPNAEQEITKLVRQYPRNAKGKYTYGTAGFRSEAKILDSVMLRVGLLAALRSRVLGGKAIGVMVTASHNPAQDNGAKIVDPSGDMMASDWEDIATLLANEEEDKVYAHLQNLEKKFNVKSNAPALVFVGRDTRESSPHLTSLVRQGATAAGATIRDYGLVTTPQLHYVVRAYNAGKKDTVEAYYDNLVAAFKDSTRNVKKEDLVPLTVDCANGIGSQSVEVFTKKLNGVHTLSRINTGDGGLNDHCGAEHVQKTRNPPLNYDPVKEKGKRFASIDGDADRLVYFYTNEQGVLKVLDGDKITSLVSGYIIELVKAGGLNLKVGVVQTAYANGASTNYISKTLGVPVDCVPTGVKYVHHKAAEHEIGVYFEANGHGTVLFSQGAIETIKKAQAAASGAAKEALDRLLALTELINQAIGDAVSDMLAVEVILANRRWSLADWDKIYDDLPSVTLKADVHDRTLIKTTDAERKCESPKGLQEEIDALVGKVPNGRSFVRPSGTENVVRIYAEASTQKEASALGESVKQVVLKLLG